MGLPWSSLFVVDSCHPRAALVIYHRFSTPLSHQKYPSKSHYHVGNSQALSLVFPSCYLGRSTNMYYTQLPPKLSLGACSRWTITSFTLFWVRMSWKHVPVVISSILNIFYYLIHKITLKDRKYCDSPFFWKGNWNKRKFFQRYRAWRRLSWDIASRCSLFKACTIANQNVRMGCLMGTGRHSWLIFLPLFWQLSTSYVVYCFSIDMDNSINKIYR